MSARKETKMTGKVKRNFDSWYTEDNVYCLFRLYQEQRAGRDVKHSELDALYTQFLSEIDAEPTGEMTLKEKMAHDGEVVLYNACEDIHLIYELVAHEFLKEKTYSQIETFLFAYSAILEIGGLTFEDDETLDFAGLEKAMNTGITVDMVGCFVDGEGDDILAKRFEPKHFGIMHELIGDDVKGIRYCGYQWPKYRDAMQTITGKYANALN